MNCKYLLSIFLCISIYGQEIDESNYDVTGESKKLKPKILAKNSIGNTGVTSISLAKGASENAKNVEKAGTTGDTGATGITDRIDDTGATGATSEIGETGETGLENSENDSNLIIPVSIYYRLGVFVNSGFYMKDPVSSKDSKRRITTVYKN